MNQPSFITFCAQLRKVNFVIEILKCNERFILGKINGTKIFIIFYFDKIN